MSKRKHEELEKANSDPTDASQEDDRPPPPPPPPLFESTPIHDRSSTFIAIFTPSTTSPRTIQRHPPFESASHRILAWRRPSAQRSIAGSFAGRAPPPSSSTTAKSLSSQGDGGCGGSIGESQKLIFETGSDEDGEQYAGKKLEKVLVDMDVQGTVVVARWYGGVLLGPVRFQWIQESAREAVRKWKVSVGKDVGGKGGDSGVGEAKRVKVDGAGDGDGDEQSRLRLVEVLKDRDRNVIVLRGLLAEKNLELKRREGAEEEKEPENSSKQKDTVKSPSTSSPDYSSMPLQRLAQMEKARDATLTWILKQIDVVEEKIKAMDQKNDGS